MPSFLLISLRNGEIGPAVAAAELHDVLESTGLGAADVEMRVIASVNDTVGPLDGFAGVIVGGSSLNITSPSYSPWQLHIHAQLSQVLSSGVPTFFVCFGISWLVDNLGGTVSHSAPEVSGPTVVNLTPAGREDPLLDGFPTTFQAFTGHTENPEVLPSPLEILATGPTCPTQIVRYGSNVWATQFHAEMDATAMKRRMDFYYDYGYFPLTEYDTIVSALPQIDVHWANTLLRRFTEFCR
ncbi:glutamine amidotransferase [Corynebacterium capitovis DSM 44611]|uniref:glutamine amidotransferase-related protein n=1 Tax=Corynebacterium capitovis TaxID=131081 RepID=UPI0003751AC8|nr:hypothetical protein [Corynebacterium capitovis]WKD57644.1 glutamine amidotransferase [Corynebacterium capitovis DSM 44611]